ncbi:MAG: 30S ribosomal protein S5 [Minisyncoccia bacterium]|jgi:small subunit ribosomal protein S5
MVRTKFAKKEVKEYDQRVLELARVTRVVAGGKRMSFRATVLIGNRKGKVGLGIAKGADVTQAVDKAVNQAKKDMLEITTSNDTIPFEVAAKYSAAQVILKPAAKGRGIVAGGAVRWVLMLAGIPNISAKIIGRTSNAINNARATFVALSYFEKNKHYTQR